MPIQRKSAIDINDTVGQLLSFLQIDGHLDSVELPGWAEGTSVSELFDAVRLVGDGQWLLDHYPDFGEFEAADFWLERFMAGEEVPSPDDEIPAEEDGREDFFGDEAPSILSGYIGALTDEASSKFVERLQDPGFAAMARRNASSCSEALTAAYVMENDEFNATVGTLACAQPEHLSDPDLAVMTLRFIRDYEAAFAALGAALPPHEDAFKRVKSLLAELEKAIALAK